MSAWWREELNFFLDQLLCGAASNFSFIYVSLYRSPVSLKEFKTLLQSLLTVKNYEPYFNEGFRKYLYVVGPLQRICTGVIANSNLSEIVLLYFFPSIKSRLEDTWFWLTKTRWKGMSHFPGPLYGPRESVSAPLETTNSSYGKVAATPSAKFHNVNSQFRLGKWYCSLAHLSILPSAVPQTLRKSRHSFFLLSHV